MNVELNVLESTPAASQGKRVDRVLHTVGSLWFAAVLLMLLSLALACATVFESSYGAERSLFTFYRSWWFTGSLALLAINVSAAIVVRFPISKAQIGFVLTHAGILLTLAGAVVTKYVAVDGQVGIAEEQTVDQFGSRDAETLIAVDRRDGSRQTLELDRSVVKGFSPRDFSKDSGELSFGGVRVGVNRYLPDSEHHDHMVNDNPVPRPAIQVSLESDMRAQPEWIFAGGTVRVGLTQIAFRVVPDQTELDRLLSEKPVAGSEKTGMVKVTHAGADYSFPLPDCLSKSVPLGESGFTMKVLRYFPHATVGGDSKVVNSSPQPTNPAIEVEIVGPEGSDTWWAFSKFPDFKSIHGESEVDDVGVTFVAPENAGPKTPIEILGTPDGRLFARFSRGGQVVSSQPIEIGADIETHLPHTGLRVHQHFDHARVAGDVESVDPVRKERVPAIEVRLANETTTDTMWLQKNKVSRASVDGVPFEMIYSESSIDLGFDLTLNKFEVGYYPGESRPRSFTSYVTITERSTGATHDRVISMNNPTDFGGYTLYQSSYRMTGGQTISFLSVARDPGVPIVFAGYIATIVGMIVVLIIRMKQRSQLPSPVARDRSRTGAGANGRGTAQPVARQPVSSSPRS